MTLHMLGIDIAKNTFQLHGADSAGKEVLKKRLPRHRLAAYIANLSACTIVMESCGGANYWARVFQGSGHTVKLISPQFVKPFVKTNKNDANDALAIVEAASRPSMNFVPIKQVEQQDKLRSYGVAQRELMPDVIHDTSQYANNRAEQSHEATRVRERGMRRFKSTGQARRFLGAHAAVSNLFNLGRHMVRAERYRDLRVSAFNEWKTVVA